MGVGRISVGEGGRCRAMVLVLPPRCLLVARAPLRGSGASIGGCLRDILVVPLVALRGYSCWSWGLSRHRFPGAGIFLTW